MESYCVSCKKYTANEKLTLLLNCAICDKKKSELL